MKKTIIIAAAALVGLAACNKENDIPAVQAGESAELTVSVRSPLTKATEVSAEDEASVNTLQVLVFNGESLDAYGMVSGETSLKLSCTAGRRTVYAVVNAAEELSGITSKAEFLKRGSLLEDNATDSFVMTGQKEVTLPQATDVDIEVSRIAARVVIRKITSALEGALADAEFSVDGIYLINVAGEQKSLMAPDEAIASDGLWLNRMHGEKALEHLTSDTLEGVSLKGRKSYEKTHMFYAYPNPTEEDFFHGTEEGKEWSARHTRLVVEATIGGETHWFPLTMPVMQANRSYEINELVIRHIGSDDPDTPVSSSEVTFSVTVRDWTQVIVSGPGESDGIWTI